MSEINEQAARREDFKGGSPVVLANGETWHLANPVVIFRAAETESGYETVLDLEGDDGAFGRLMADRETTVAAYRRRRDDPDAAASEPPPADLRGIDIRIGTLLLRRNYEVTLTQVGALMPFSYDEGTEAARIFQDVMAVAHGNGPKPEGGGTD